MDPLSVVEQQLGSVDIRPSGILTAMFRGDELNLRGKVCILVRERGTRETGRSCVELWTETIT